VLLRRNGCDRAAEVKEFSRQRWQPEDKLTTPQMMPAVRPIETASTGGMVLWGRGTSLGILPKEIGMLAAPSDRSKMHPSSRRREADKSAKPPVRWQGRE
jgi:hypothetical protein